LKLTANQIAGLANSIAHAFGLKDDGGALLSFDAPPPASAPRKGIDALYTRLGIALDAKKPSKHAPAIGEMIAILVWSIRLERPTRWPPQPPPRSRDAKRALAELIELVAQGAYERTKRAERGRVFAELFVLFDLESILGITVAADEDIEEVLRRTIRAAKHR
jgi:hypothetical protein